MWEAFKQHVRSARHAWWVGLVFGVSDPES